MPDIATIITSGSANAWLYLPAAVALGALHGLEPGHSKSMMASFIIAVRGTMAQAAVLGLSAAFSHSLVVWALAMLGLALGNALIAEHATPYLMAVSGLLIIAMALWMLSRSLPKRHHHGHDHHDHDHHHDHADESTEDAHAAAHAREIQQKYAGRTVTTWQVAMFGLTGGLLPCPASGTVLLCCLQLKKFTLGIAMVAAFSIGLALTLVAAGVAAAWGLRHAEKRFGNNSTFSKVIHYMPIASACLMVLLGTLVFLHGFLEIIPTLNP